MAGFALFVADGFIGRFASKPVAAAGDFNHFGVLQEAVEDGGRARYVTDQFAPIFKRSVAGHHRAAQLMSAHDDLEQELAAAFGKLLHAHVIKYQQVWLEVTIQDAVMPFKGFVMQEVSDAVEDAAVVHRVTVAYELATDGLN